MSVRTASEALEASLRTVDGLRVYRDPGALIEPPAALVGPPAVTFDAYAPEPTTATFIVHLVVAANDRALERLWDLIPPVTAALATVTDAVVTRADPGVFNAGGTDLPAYAIEVETSL